MRSALLGSPGVGTRYRTSLRVGGLSPQARLANDAAATYAAVVALHHLDIQTYVPGIGLVTDVIVFTGAEATRAAFLATILAQAKHFTAIVASLNRLEFRTYLMGSLAAATVLASSSADVLTSLGLVGNTAFPPAFGVRLLGAPHYGQSAAQYFGGKKPTIGGIPQSANQHGLTFHAANVPAALIVDRNQPKTVSSDLVRFRPSTSPGADAPVPPVGPDLGAASTFAVLAGTTVTNTVTPTSVTGDLGISPGNALTNFPPGTVTGTEHLADGPAAAAEAAAVAAYIDLASRVGAIDLTGLNLGGMVLTPGIYKFTAGAPLTGTLTLDAQGNPNALFIFQIGTTLITAAGALVTLINGADPKNVFWQVGSSATFGTTTAFKGTVIALTAITFNTLATLLGRAFARNAAVTLDNNTIVKA